MSSHNYLNIGNFLQRNRDEYIMFRWGFIREIIYNIGDIISWDVWGRPSKASKLTSIAGNLYIRNDPIDTIYVCITVSEDKIVSYRQIDEIEFININTVTEKIIEDLISNYTQRVNK